MASYRQWLAASVKSPPSRVTWVCGAERVLVNEVMDAVIEAIGADDSVRWHAGRDRERDIWSAVLALPASDHSRVTVVHDAGRLRDWRQLQRWLGTRSAMPGCYVLFEDSEPDFPKDKAGKLAAPTDMLRDSPAGQIVRCQSLSPDDAIDWARHRFPQLSSGQAARLLLRASGDLGEASAVLAKARLFSGRISDEVIDLLCAELPGEFTDALVLKDLPGAMLAAGSMAQEGIGLALAVLASRLEVLAVLHRAARENVSRRDVTVRLGVPAFLVQKYSRIAAAEYGERRVSRAWSALSVAEGAYRAGAAGGVAEVLVTAWWL